ncbi:MAG: hypothetical protein ACYTG2_03800 [Planctomycetota bacterium]
MDLVLDALLTSGRQLAVVLGPLAAVAVCLRLVERALSARLTSRLGWGGVWLTGWLGVPIHELSHAAACVLFGHRLRRVRLFAPDRRTGRLGGVEHSFDPRNPWQQLGRFFIGVAPLIGGAGALWLLTWLCGPQGVALAPLEAPGATDGLVMSASENALRMLSALTEPQVLQQWTTWLYLYICLCIGTHISPSRPDLEGGWPGFLLLVVLVFLANVVVLLVGGSAAVAERLALSVAAPLFVLLFVALVLAALCLVLVMLATWPLPERRL